MVGRSSASALVRRTGDAGVVDFVEALHGLVAVVLGPPVHGYGAPVVVDVVAALAVGDGRNRRVGRAGPRSGMRQTREVVREPGQLPVRAQIDIDTHCERLVSKIDACTSSGLLTGQTRAKCGPNAARQARGNPVGSAGLAVNPVASTGLTGDLMARQTRKLGAKSELRPWWKSEFGIPTSVGRIPTSVSTLPDSPWHTPPAPPAHSLGTVPSRRNSANWRQGLGARPLLRQY